MADDHELLKRWRDGDQGAGSELFARHFRAVYRFFRNKLDHNIEDLVQQTFLGCVEGRDRLREDTSFRAYLFAVARNQLYRAWTARSRGRNIDFGATSLDDLGPSPSSVAARRQEQQLLLAALRKIPVDLQIALELYHWEGLRGREIAVALGIPEPTVRSRLRRANEKLREQLQELAQSPQLLQSTTTDLDGWARSLRELLDRDAPRDPSISI